MKLINLINSKGRDAHIEYFNPSSKTQALFVTANGQSTASQRILKSTISAQDLIQKAGEVSSVAQMLIDHDHEVDLESIGRYANESTRVFVNEENKFVFNIHQKEEVYNPQGQLLEERKPKYLLATVTEDSPLRGTKYLPKSEIYNKFVFARKYQLKHVNSLTYDFLFEIAKDLHDKQSFLLLGSGLKGTGPLVFENGGRPYRAFLEGRVSGDKYLLLLHLSNLELKALNP